jgi:hypothetical protein
MTDRHILFCFEEEKKAYVSQGLQSSDHNIPKIHPYESKEEPGS